MFGQLEKSQLIAPWSSEDMSRTWQVLSDRADRLIRRGARSAGFEAILVHTRKLLLSYDLAALEAAMESKRVRRAVVMLWTEDPSIAKMTLRKSVLGFLTKEPERLSRLVVSSLIRLHLQYFSDLNQWEGDLFGSMASTISSGVNGLETAVNRPGIAESVRSSPERFLELSGPMGVAQELLTSGRQLEDFLTESGLRGFDGGEYGQQVRLWYYIEQIRAADPAQDHGFLSELARPAVYRAPIHDGFFGHRVLEALADKDEKPSTAWLDTILTIAGDPRLEHTKKWFEWWNPLAPQALSKVKSWLSAEDLRLFLAAVEEYGDRTGKADLQRMFPDRKKFLEGLLALGVVKETRLILGAQAKEFVRRRMGKSLISDIALFNKDPQKSIIFVDCGTFHFLEGSHSFPIWTYVGTPAPSLLDRRIRGFTPAFLREDIPYEFLMENSENARYTSTYHHSTELGTWQFKVIDFLASQGIHLHYKALVMPGPIAEYSRRHGLPSR